MCDSGVILKALAFNTSTYPEILEQKWIISFLGRKKKKKKDLV